MPLAPLFAALIVSALLAAALHDIAARTIPNRLCLAIAVAGLLARALAGDLPGAIAAMALVFALAVVAWRLGALGGGDAKLLAACALVVPPSQVPALLLATALAGGVLALAFLAARPLVVEQAVSRPNGLTGRVLRIEARRVRRGGPLPYAVAIAVGTFFTLFVGS